MHESSHAWQPTPPRARRLAPFAACALCLAAITWASLGAAVERTAVIDPSAAGPVWRGWGTSLAWWANVVGGAPEPMRSQVCEKVFRDLGLNIARYLVGAGDSAGTEAQEPRTRMPRFLKRELTYDWTVDANQRWVLQRAKELGADTFEAFACSPPPWMTQSLSVTGGESGASNLRPDAVHQFAEHLATVARHFRDWWGITFETISPMNEPEADWWKRGGRQEGCRVDPGKEQAFLLTSLDRALGRQRIATRTSGPESWSPQRAAEAWDLLGEPVRRTMGHISTHGYGGGEGRTALRDRVRRAKLPLWMSEYGDADASGLTMARQIVSDLRDMQPSAWVYWQAVDAGGWGCIDLDVNKPLVEPRPNRKFDMLAQFSRFIRPGARLVGASDASTVAAMKWNQLVVVTVGGESDDTLRIDVSRVDATGEPARVVRSSASEAQVELAPAPVKDGALRIDVPARSVVTVVVPVKPAATPKPDATRGTGSGAGGEARPADGAKPDGATSAAPAPSGPSKL